MSIKAYRSVSANRTPQSEPILGREDDMSRNYAGGFAFTLDKWSMLDRFLIIGTSSNTYYVSARDLTKENAKNIIECLDDSPRRTIDRIVEISEAGRAINNDPALYALAIATAKTPTYVTSHHLQSVARTSTHLFHYLEFVQQFRGWGRSLRDLVSSWYNNKPFSKLEYQVVKYRQRDGWTHQDVLRLAHPRPGTYIHDAIFAWICSGSNEKSYNRWIEKRLNVSKQGTHSLDYINAYEAAKDASSEEEIIELIRNHNLTFEMIPTEYRSAKVWEALLRSMPLWAMVRNLRNMTKAGLLTTSNFYAVHTVASRLRDVDYIHLSRMHPLAILKAIKAYSTSEGAMPQIIDALNDAFYLSFDNVEPTNKNIMLALDVSGSMSWSFVDPIITCAEAAGALALVTANVEPNYILTAFSSAGENDFQAGGRYGAISTINISPKQRLDDVLNQLQRMGFGGTDCALPMLYASERRMKIDAFVVLTDNETWHGDIHPSQALNDYRREYNSGAKLIVVGMTGTEFTIADPKDPGSLDVVGFDTATPNLISEFTKGI